MFYLSNNSKKNMAGIEQDLINVANLAIQISVVDFGIPSTGGLRTAEFQKGLCDKGLSNCDGYKDISRHQTGEALDFYAYVDGKASWDDQHLTMVAAAFLQAASILCVQLEWGGLWKGFKDFPHVQLKL